MSAKKYEKVTPGNSFWKKSSTAIPGRPNPSKGQPAPPPQPQQPQLSGSAAAFHNFDSSVSDAWDARDALGASAASAAPSSLAGGKPKLLASSPSPLHAATGTVKTTAAVTTARNAAAAKEETGRRSSSDKSAAATAARSPTASPTNAAAAAVNAATATAKPPTILPVTDKAKCSKLEALFERPSIDLEELRKLSWSGIPRAIRSKAWKILCGYLPGNASRQEDVIKRKQEEYQRYVQQYFVTRDEDVHQDIYRQIHIDIPRMSPVVGIFQQRCVQEIFERILYIWALRHPASGYVQGINDLVTPFFLVFLQDFSPKDVNEIVVEEEVAKVDRDAIEADSFWCLSKVLDGIQDNYTFAQPGIQQKVKQLEELVKRTDAALHGHLVAHDVAYLQFAFRWMNNLLMRELPIGATIRLWDTYLAQPDGFSHFHLYVCAAFLVQWQAELFKRRDFHTLLMFLQNVPTAKWKDAEISLIVAEAYRLSYLFADAPNHLMPAKFS